MEKVLGSITRAYRSGRSGAFSYQCSRSFTETASVKPGEIGEVSGIPDKHLKRRVVIYSPARSASTQGNARTPKWKINFVSTEKWENPLMGWTSTGDPYANLGESALVFEDKQSAIDFALKYGWDYMVKEPHVPIIKTKAYADNFKFKGPPNTEED